MFLMAMGTCAPACFAEAVSIAGTVTDSAGGAPLKGVVVKLAKSGLLDTTDAAGTFLLQGGTTGLVGAGPSQELPVLQGDGSIRVRLEGNAPVSLRTFSLQGALLASWEGYLTAGSHDLATGAQAPGIRIHRVRIGDRETVLRQVWSEGTAMGASTRPEGTVALSRGVATSFGDTLVASLSGYGTARVALSSATATGLGVRLAKSAVPAVVKARVINTTDLQADPDDEQSLVHMFVTSNEVDIEGLIVVTSCWRKGQSGTSYIDKLLTAYETSYPNLKVHASDFPTPAYLKSIVTLGQKGYSMADVGVGKDSPGSNQIIAAVDKDDPRPVWVNLWGGANTLAQAITKVKATRTQAQLDQFLSKLRVYDVLGQDEAGAWIVKNFPSLLYIRATGVYGWQYDAAWVASNVQNKGALGAVYPTAAWAIEGDTPAFMHQLANGLNDPDKIEQGGWGGRFDLAKKTNIASMSAVTGEGAYQPYLMYGNTSDGAGAIKRWSDGYTNDFAARMLWSTTGSYGGANHHPVAVVNGDKTRNVLYVTAKAGTDVVLDGAGSSDPDKNSLTWSWSLYADPSTEKTATITGGNTSKATVKAPSAGKTLHIVLVLKDSGSPALTAYRRVVITGS